MIDNFTHFLMGFYFDEQIQELAKQETETIGNYPA
jgi:hypothetical protein